MLDPAFVREHVDEVRTGLRNRGLDPDTLLEPFAALDAKRRDQILEVEGLKRELARGTNASSIAVFYRVHAQSRVLEQLDDAAPSEPAQMGAVVDA